MELSPKILYTSNFTGTRMNEQHYHNGAELIYIAKGNCTNSSKDGSFYGRQGQFFVVPPHLHHKQVNHCEVTTFFVVFEPNSYDFNLKSRVIRSQNDPFVETWMIQMRKLFLQKHAEECNELLKLLLIHLKGIEDKSNQYVNLPDRMQLAVRYISEHFNEDLEVSKIAQKYSFSPSYFNSLFKRHIGESPISFLKNCRMAHARFLLFHSTLQVSEVSQACGYSTPHYFCRLFKQLHGVTPGEYRKERDDSRLEISS